MPVTVHLTNGEKVSVPTGVRGEFHHNSVSESTTTPTEVDASLDIYNAKDYAATKVASFKREEVLGFTVEPEPLTEAGGN